MADSGVVLFGEEKEPTVSNGTTTSSLGGYGAPGSTGFFPSTIDAADQSLQVGDDLWVAVFARPTNTLFSYTVTVSMPSGWTRTFYSKLDLDTTYRGIKDVSFYNYGPSPVDASGWAAWAPNVTLVTSGLTFPTSLTGAVIRPFAIRDAATAPQFAAYAAGLGADPRTPAIDTWTGTDIYSIGMVGGPSYSGGGVTAGNMALYPSGDGPINGWDLAQNTVLSAIGNRTWYGRVTDDTAAPQFICVNQGWFWFGFQISAVLTGWSIDTISY